MSEPIRYSTPEESLASYRIPPEDIERIRVWWTSGDVGQRRRAANLLVYHSGLDGVDARILLRQVFHA